MLPLEVAGEVAGELLVEAAGDGGAVLAQFAHAVEEHGLFAVVGGLVGLGEQRVVDLLEGVRQIPVEMTHLQAQASLLELAEAWLDGAAGEGGRWRMAHDGLTGQRPVLK
ncbi:hypothetical protein D3C78_538910 [compost metagenome]